MTAPARAPEPIDPGAAQRRREDVQSLALRLVDKRDQTLMSLFELSHELSISLDPHAIADLALFNLMGHFGAPRAAMWLAPDEPGPPVLLRAHGLREEAARAIGAALLPRLADQYTYEQGPVQLAEWAEEELASGAELALASGLAVLVPVPAHGRLLGLIALGTRVSGDLYRPMDLDHLGAAAGMVGVAVQNTRHYHRIREANRRLEETNAHLNEVDRLKSQFVQGVNHELRTPLSIVIGYLDCLAGAEGLDEVHHRAVEGALKEARKLSGLVENLLDFSAAERGGLEVASAEHDVRNLLEPFAETRRSGVIEALREFQWVIPHDLPRVRCDAKRLLQALNLLVDNAVKFTPLGSHIRLSAGPWSDGTKACVRIQVEDDGPGIPQQFLTALFDPFRQADGSTTRAVSGMGMGLALARDLVQRMDGRLEVTSIPGTGTTFSVLLPAGRP